MDLLFYYYQKGSTIVLLIILVTVCLPAATVEDELGYCTDESDCAKKLENPLYKYSECANQKLKKCDTWRECLELNYYVDLVNKLNIQGIVAELRQHRLITQPLYDEITGTVVGQTANTLYIQHLVRTGVEETFGKFVKVLEETSQDFAIHREILNTFWCDAMLGTIMSLYDVTRPNWKAVFNANLSKEEVKLLIKPKIDANDRTWMLLSNTGVGKSTFGNFLLNDNVFEVSKYGSAEMGLSMTVKSEMHSTQYQQRKLYVIDTPGLGDTGRIGKRNTEAKEFANEVAHLSIELSKALLMAKNGIHTFFVMIRADDKSHYGTEKLLQLLDIFGDLWSHTVLCLTHGKSYRTSSDEQRSNFNKMLADERAPQPLKDIVRKSGGRFVIVEGQNLNESQDYREEKVAEIVNISDEIVQQHGVYNDLLQTLALKYFDAAKLELRHQYNPEGPEIIEPAWQRAFQKISEKVYEIVLIKLAEGSDTEVIKKIVALKEEELENVYQYNDKLEKEVLKEKEERRKVEEENARIKKEKEIQKERARKAEEEERRLKREVDEYLAKPIFAERRITYDVDSGWHSWEHKYSGFVRWQYKYTATAKDEGSGITAEAQHYDSEHGAKEHARENLRAKLLHKGIIRKD